jgi:hypothetical protein
MSKAIGAASYRRRSLPSCDIFKSFQFQHLISAINMHLGSTGQLCKTNLVLGVRGVAEDSAVEKSAVNIANHGTNVTGRVLLLGLTLTGLKVSDVILHYAVES